MSTVGIIANPASGKDIRRLVAHASVYDNQEKANILRRMLLALEALGVGEVQFMPDYGGLVEAALKGLNHPPHAVPIPMQTRGDEQDSTEAARRLCEKAVGCIVTLGGDGTNRAVSKGCGDIPVVAVSTGTNNVFPEMIEGTVAGLAAGLVAERRIDVDKVSYRAKRLEVSIDGQMAEVALIDVVTCSDLFLGSRAVWDPGRINEIILARAEPDSIGMSSIGGLLHPVGCLDPHGMYIRLGRGGMTVLAPVAPGILSAVEIQSYRLLPLNEEVVLEPAACTLAVDGERQIEVFPEQRISVRLVEKGPRVVEVDRCLEAASRLGVFRKTSGSSGGLLSVPCLGSHAWGWGKC